MQKEHDKANIIEMIRLISYSSKYVGLGMELILRLEREYKISNLDTFDENYYEYEDVKKYIVGALETIYYCISDY